jgi:hypothetical protein
VRGLWTLVLALILSTSAGAQSLTQAQLIARAQQDFYACGNGCITGPLLESYFLAQANSFATLSGPSPGFSSPTTVFGADGATLSVQNGSIPGLTIYSPFSYHGAQIFDAMRSVIDINAGTGIGQVDAIAGYVYNNVAAGSPGPTANNAVASYGLCIDAINGASCWGADFVASDSPGGIIAGTGRTIYGVEADLTVFSSGSTTNVDGFLAVMQGSQTPASAYGFQAYSAAGAAAWSIGFLCPTGSCGTALLAGAAAVGASQSSQVIGLEYYTSGSALGALELQANSIGALQIYSSLLNDQIELAPESGGNVEIAAFSIIDPTVNVAIAGQGSGSATQFFAGSTLTAKINTSGIQVPGLPVSAGGGGMYVCVDSTGIFYKKSSCP